MTEKTRPPFKLGRNDACFCGSGQRFKHCCGSTSTTRKTPHGIVIEENFLGAEECQAILAVAKGQESERLKLFDVEKTTLEKVVRKYDDNRVTQRVDMTEYQAILEAPVRRAITQRIEPELACTIDWFEEPHILRYEPGGFYASHADSENFDPEKKLWERALDRDVSLLLYLDDDYEDGELSFGNFDFKLRPRSGMLVYFPSDSRYMHAALPVGAGIRHAIVSWLSQTGVEKMRTPPEKAVILRSLGD